MPRKIVPVEQVPEELFNKALREEQKSPKSEKPRALLEAAVMFQDLINNGNPGQVKDLATQYGLTVR